jgi:DME family drug/metabolite transporter
MVAGCLWGTFGIIAKTLYAQTTMGPISLAFYRLVPAIPTLVLLTLVRKYTVSIRDRRELALFVGFGFFSLTLFEVLYFSSLGFTTVQHAAALLYTAPAFVALLSWLILKERLGGRKIVAVILSIAGAFLILGLSRSGGLFASRTQIGDWLAVTSGLAYSSWYIFGKLLGRGREPAVTVLLGLSFGAIQLAPLMIVFEGFTVPTSIVAWELVLAVGIVPTALAYVLYLSGLRYIDATRASVYAIMEPLSSALLAFYFFGETLALDSLLGFLLIISSIVLISTRNQSTLDRAE